MNFFNTFTLGIALLFISVFSDDPVINVCTLTLYSLIIIWIYRYLTIDNPITLYVVFFLAYTVIYPLQVLILNYSLLPIDNKLLANAITYQHLFIFAYVTTSSYGLSPNQLLRKNLNKYYGVQNGYSKLGDLFLLLFIFMGIIFLSYTISKIDVESKRELLEEASSGVKYGSFILLLLTVIVFRKVLTSSIWISKFWIIFYFIILIYFALLTGERDSLFRGLLILSIIYLTVKGSSSFNYGLLIILSALFIIPISQEFKAIFFTRELNLGNPLSFASILSNEFISASRNFYSLLYYGANSDINFFFNDLARAFLPSIDLLKFEPTSTVSWFHNQYRPDNNFSGSSGWGFSIVGSSFLLFGFLSVLISGMLLGWVTRFFYSVSIKTPLLYIYYLLLLTVNIYVIRADFANYFSAVFKINLLIIILYIFYHRILFLSIKKQYLLKGK
jgi:hypothetical protein